MLYVITKGERQFLIDTLEECKESSEDLEDACDESIDLLLALEPKTQEEYENES